MLLTLPLQGTWLVRELEHIIPTRGFPDNPPAMQETQTDTGSICRLGRSPEGGHGNPLRNSFLENPMDRGAWQAVIHSVTQSRTGLKRLSTHRHRHSPLNVPLFFPICSHFLCLEYSCSISTCLYTIFWKLSLMFPLLPVYAR